MNLPAMYHQHDDSHHLQDGSPCADTTQLVKLAKQHPRVRLYIVWPTQIQWHPLLADCQQDPDP
jgi:hypothetical protein